MKIRRITRFSKSVYEAVLRLLPQLSLEAQLSEESFKILLRSANTYFFISELENRQIVGMLTLATCNLASGKKFWIEDVVVDESQRGKGFGKELVLFALSFSKSLGADNVTLTSRPSRVAANKLYTEIGFVRYETNVYKYKIYI